MTSPFAGPQAFAGSAPLLRPMPDNAFPRRVWFGKPGAMVEWPSPSASSGLDAPQSRGRVVHGLSGGATAVNVMPNTARSWTFAWPALTGRDWEVLDGFDRGAFGSGPFVLLNPEGRNRLTLTQSMCSGLRGTVEGWAPSAGTVAVGTSAPAVTPSGVIRFNPAAAGNKLQTCPTSDATGTLGQAGKPDTVRSPVNAPGEPFTAYFYVAAISGTAQVQAQIDPVDAAGATQGTVAAGPARTVGTDPVLVYVAVPSGAFPAAALYLLPELVSLDGHAVAVSSAFAGYTAESVPWCLGGGTPRVVITAGLADRKLLNYMRSVASMSVAESVLGAA